MKKVIIIIIIIVVIALLFSPEKEVRIRVIANSDSIQDQRMKLDVARYLENLLLETRDLGIIKKEVEYVISSYNCDYTVSVAYKDQRFETKYIDNKVIPGGVYKTLVIEIGKAEGKNYWSMLYPEYFNVDFEDVNSGDVEFGWWLKDFFRG